MRKIKGKVLAFERRPSVLRVIELCMHTQPISYSWLGGKGDPFHTLGWVEMVKGRK